MNPVLKIYSTFTKFPFGNWMFSKLVCFKAPYFSSVKPIFAALEPGFCEIKLKKRRAVTNHIKSVHAIAMCNISELAAGTALEVTIPKNLRWIPKRMEVEYLKVANTDLVATCQFQEINWDGVSDLPLTVDVTDKNGEVVFKAVIFMYISAKG